MGHDIFDLVIILTLVFFTIRGISQGFIAEAAGIVSLLVGFWVAKTYNGVLEPYLTFLSDPGWRSICRCGGGKGAQENNFIFLCVMGGPPGGGAAGPGQGRHHLGPAPDNNIKSFPECRICKGLPCHPLFHGPD